MITFFTNRELSRKLNINLAKWKRWSREFLPPDPLGGMQSGYTRQYHPDQAFTVYLGGYLVADLKFAIPEARQILNDLEAWFRDTGFLFAARGYTATEKRVEARIKKYIIYILCKNRRDSGVEFSYAVRGIIANEPDVCQGVQVMKELYEETRMGPPVESFSTRDAHITKVLDITNVLMRFVEATGLDRNHYPVIS